MAGVKGCHGGARPGAGRPRRDPSASWLAGNTRKRGPRRVETPPAVAKPVLGDVKRPKDLPEAETVVWGELAPHALGNGTLTPATAVAFAMLCRNVVIERKLSVSPLGVAGPDHRGMLARVEGLMLRFGLVPNGKAIAAPAADDKDEWQEFDSGLALVK